MATAGRAVILSGLTVAIGLLSLIVLPVPGLRSVGYGGMLIPLVSTGVSLTLLPAIRCPHEEQAVSDALDHLLTEGAELLLVVGASAVVDRRDVGPAGLDGPAHPSGGRRHVGPRDAGGFGLAVKLRVEDRSLPQAELEALAREAHEKICPYSHATRGNVPVEFEVVGA